MREQHRTVKKKKNSHCQTDSTKRINRYAEPPNITNLSHLWYIVKRVVIIYDNNSTIQYGTVVISNNKNIYMIISVIEQYPTSKCSHLNLLTNDWKV